MIKPEEGQYLHWLTKTYWTGNGLLIEIGTWLGRSTLHLASGLKERESVERVICYDHFEWAGGGGWNQKNAPQKSVGSDFMQEFMVNTKPFSNWIEARRSKIQDIRLPNEKVEVIVLDAPKRTIDISSILIQLANRTIPEQTVMAWQDFLHPPSFEIPAALYALHDHLDICHFVTEGTVVGFKIETPWTARDALPAQLSYKTWSLEEAIEAWDFWLALIPERELPSFRTGLAMLLHDIGYIEAAQRVLEDCLSDPLALARWKKWDDTSLPKRYEALFTMTRTETAEIDPG